MTTITYTAPCPTCGADCEWVSTRRVESNERTTAEALCGCGEVAA